MPFVHIRIAGMALTPEQVRHMQDEATRLMATVMRKKRELTAVLVEQAPADAWTVAAEPVRVAGHLDVKVTEGTNTVEEKSRFIAAAAKLLKDALGSDLPVATYVVVHELAADSWGYDGLSQEYRRKTGPVALTF